MQKRTLAGRFILDLIGIILLFFALSTSVNAQGFIAASTFLGGAGNEQQAQLVVDNGFSYIVGQSVLNSGTNDFPVTTGGGASSTTDLTVTKLDANGNVVWSRFLGGNNDDYPSRLAVTNGSLLIVGSTQSTNYPVTDGSIFQGSGLNGFFTRLDANTGAIQFSTIYGKGSGGDIEVADGYIYVIGTDANSTSTYNDVMLVKYDAVTTAMIYRKQYGGTDYEGYSNQWYGKNFKVAGNTVYMAFISGSYDFPTTDGTSNPWKTGIIYAKVDAVNGNLSFATFFGGNSYADVADLRVDNTGVYIYGYTAITNFPVTDGSVFGGMEDAYIVKFHLTSNKLLYGKYIGGDDYESPVGMEVQNGTVYLVTNSNSFKGFPVTTGMAYAQGGGDIAVLKLDANTGDINYSSFITASSSADNATHLSVVNGEMYIAGYTYSNNYPVTNGSVNVTLGMDEVILTKIGTNNSICFSTYLGHNSSDYAAGLAVAGNDVYLAGITNSTAFPVTTTVSKRPRSEFFWTKFNLNPSISSISDVVSPASQTVCKNGVATGLTAPPVVFTSGSMPLIYRLGVPYSQNAIDTRYQWQVAPTATGPWTNIAGAVDRNYSPQGSAIDQYYRRNAYASSCATGAVLSTSSVAAVLVNSNFAPVVNAGGVINTCSNVAVTLGGSPTATPTQRNAAISSYTWTPATAVFSPSATVANPSVTPATSGIYTVTVTDINGCTQVGQVLVNAYVANAGADVSTCNNRPVRIGNSPIAGLPGVVYAWSAVAGDAVSKLSCTNCAQPDVNNLTQVSTYRLTLTVPVSGGATCTTTDDVVITPVTGPTTSFGAPDVTICAGGSVALGFPAEAGFDYTWSPGNYLATNATTPTFFQSGLYEQFSPNPFTYYLTAAKGGCFFVDTLVATVLKADAGSDKCGPTLIGNPDHIPVPGATYTWTKITAGPGTANFTGATTGFTVPVSACTSPTIFQLTVSKNGVSCTDQVLVSACGCSVPTIEVKSPSGCPSNVLNGGPVTLAASTALPATFTWTTTGGVTLSAYSGATVTVTNTAAGTVTVTATNLLDASSFCSTTIDVNHPAWSLPSFKAKDTTVCPGTAVLIGQTPVAGYSYLWSGLIANLAPGDQVANPQATVNSTANFPVLVTDVGSGCTFRDTATVTIIGFPPGLAGTPVNFCGVSTTVQLGRPVLPNTTYVWTPATTYAPNNTAANPTVTVATSTTFYVTATNTITGCSVTDSVRITVNPAVPPFSFSDQSFCPGTTGTMALPAGPTGMAQYQWSPAALVINASSNGPVATTQFNPPQSATTYTLNVTNASGCTGQATVRFVPSIVPADAGPNRSICLNTTTQLGAAPEAGATYAWTGTAIARLNATNIANPVFTPTNIGSFTFTLTKTVAGCSATAQVSVTVVNFAIPAMVSPTVCENTCVQIGTFSQSGVQYYWSPTAGLSNPLIHNPVACVGSTNRLYTLTAIGVNGCVSKQDVIVGVNPTLSPSVVIPSITTCLGGSIDLFQPMISPAGNYNYLWSPNNGTLSDIYIATPTVATNKLGTANYTLNVSDPLTGCATNATAQITTLYCNVLELAMTLKATPAGSVVNLQWLVPRQPGIAYYELEHSSDGVHFSLLQKLLVRADGRYQWQHKNPAQGNNFYRIRYTDVQGKYGYSSIEKVSLVSQQDVTVYPNPARHFFNLLVSNELAGKAAEIILIAADGRTVLQKKISSLNRIEQVSLAGMGAGKYFVRLVLANGIVLREVTVLQ